MFCLDQTRLVSDELDSEQQLMSSTVCPFCNDQLRPFLVIRRDFPITGREKEVPREPSSASTPPGSKSFEGCKEDRVSLLSPRLLNSVVTRICEGYDKVRIEKDF